VLVKPDFPLVTVGFSANFSPSNPSFHGARITVVFGFIDATSVARLRKHHGAPRPLALLTREGWQDLHWNSCRLPVGVRGHALEVWTLAPGKPLNESMNEQAASFAVIGPIEEHVNPP
jgi:hypothetical protein